MAKKQVIQVFEHERLPIGDVFQRKHWQALSRYNEKGKSKFFELQRNGIKLKQFVGVIQAGNLTIEILPKIDNVEIDEKEEKSSWHRVLLEMYRHSTSVNLSVGQRAWLAREKGDLLTLYIRLFLDDVEKLTREGLLKNYHRTCVDAGFLKGAIDFPRHIAKNTSRPDRISVKSSVYSKDNLYNQVLLAALDMVPVIAADSSLLLQHKRISDGFVGVKRIPITEQEFGKLRRSRKSARYMPALQMAEMLLTHCRPATRGGSIQVLAILFDMNVLWQDYIFNRLLGAGGQGIQVKRTFQHFWQKPDGGTPRKIKPDIVIQWDNHTVVIDTKWKLPKNYSPADADLKQIFVYNLYWEAVHGVLLFPGRASQEKIGAFLEFNHMPYPTHCGILTCNILGDDNLLDLALGARLMKQIQDLASRMLSV
jgi:5-methylcytosine-specific restriction enzyme subunit McrC